MKVESIENITVWIEFYKLKTIDRMACPLFHDVEHKLTDNKTHAKSDRLQVPLLINIDIKPIIIRFIILLFFKRGYIDVNINQA